MQSSNTMLVADGGQAPITTADCGLMVVFIVAAAICIVVLRLQRCSRRKS